MVATSKITLQINITGLLPIANDSGIHMHAPMPMNNRGPERRDPRLKGFVVWNLISNFSLLILLHDIPQRRTP